MNFEQLCKNKRLLISTIKKHIIETLDGNKIQRQFLVNAVISRLGFTKAQLRDTSVDSLAVVARSIIGAIITEGISLGDIIEDGDILSMSITETYPPKAEIEECVNEILKDNIARGREEIFDLCIERLGANKTFSEKDNEVIRAVAGGVLATGEKNGRLCLDGSKYVLKQESEESIDELSKFLDSINSQGGEYFERYGAMLLRKYYEKCGFIVTQCCVTGGSDDGGIDIIIRTEDKLGFKEFVAVQAKARRSLHVTVKEVREFYGAMVARGASRGIYLTTSKFHLMAEEFIDNIPNLTRIDGEALFEIAKECKLFKV